MRRAYQNGIGTGKKQLDLGPFNSLFSGASGKADLRMELAVKHELERQAAPVIINELMVRGLYFVRRFIEQMREKKSVMELDWKGIEQKGGTFEKENEEKSAFLRQLIFC